MFGDLDPILEQAKHDANGNPAIAHLQRQDEDYWDALVVGRDGQPLTFLAKETGFGGEFAREDGTTLMVVVSTPPGVSPAGLSAMPADESGSPLTKFVSVVTGETTTEVEPPDDGAPRQAPARGPDLLKSLLERAAYRDQGGFLVADLEAADGGKAAVLLDWDRRPMMVWVEMPGEGRIVTMVTSLPGSEGLVCQAVGEDLRPLHSGEGLIEMRDRQV